MQPKIGIKSSANLGVSANGAEAFTIKFFLRYLKEFNYQVDIVGAESLPEELLPDNHYFYFKINHLPRFLRSLMHIPISILSVFIYCFRHKPDLLFITGGVFYNGLAIYLCGKLFGIKVVVRTAEDHFNFYKYTSTLVAKIHHFFVNRLISSLILRNVNYVLTTGIESKRYFIEKGSSPSGTYGIPGYVEKEKFKKTQNDFRKENYIPEDKILVLYVGAVSGVKGANFLRNIIYQVNQESDDYFFLIVGNENEAGSNITKDLRNSKFKNLKILPPQSREVLVSIYSSSDVLLFLCQVGVGYGQVTIEAALCELPVLSLDPGLDVKWWLGDNCCNTTKDLSARLINRDFKVPVLPDSFEEEYIKVEYQKFFETILKEAK